MPGKLLLAALLLLANAAVIGLWWIGTEPDAYLWTTRATADVTERVREAGLAVFWWRWPVWAILLNGTAAAVLLVRRAWRRAAVVAGAALLCAFGLDRWGDRQLADEYFTLFQLQYRAEPLVTEPLLQAGPSVGPFVVAHVADRGAEHRLYAIGALGEIGFEPAVPLLIRVMNDTTESVYIRAGAWKALREIGTDEARASTTRFEAALKQPGADSALAAHMRRLRRPEAR
ncbi:MAG: hypothetical protein AVDCRST_MAG89-3638 [uncultured Gemmatimonadetes bacterium]|uniref:HEAT repeat domain-containing protein n=1 Tax=uncultured Gemmatimonadota bacterium TaxID=203437 RepID=A0A6J4MHF7_9BACT|nr:MAG: hypothetical protein AVDCRST_MAG89-3638 [uncultured Gemmatimonadota bacterium]